MTIRVGESLLHWNYFLALESDLEDVSRFIEFSKKNFLTYSIELAHLLLASSSEVDVLAKEICKLVNSESQANNIIQYRDEIVKRFPNFHQERVFVTRYGLNFRPWENWENNETPNWWRSHNKVKHERNDHFEDANLQNTLNAMGGLLITVFYFYKLRFEVDDPAVLDDNREVMQRLQPESKLLRLNENYYPSYLLLE